ncbi:6-phosphogluconolactonase [Chimaeribacter arupi]|uniref:6-phosphogluconolactonase n=1 Tax=Nissabacter archeti TaxID=1917880 RepID=A0ABS5JI24_9GAMM|nr:MULTISPECIES: 6-phosphogluconolactonase [Yersiniaceae]MBS0969570.1 6-phosphogluconolactonase [Nissabacter archeti]MDV5142316.1 6-phosphogluconolactonase [Chimaeribacter arupi]PLR35263.1 6-phosphogluconolactonase [Chimaeribacter arupi]PLR48470.1 6-phosphogluconolactonase [Chimaeribacter arupi]WKZ91328.1 6-phosphogluconolactonase [Chimaeribacter arupi]
MKQVVYVASPDSQQIHAWQLAGDGTLTLLQTVDVPGQVQPMVLRPDNRFLYVGVRPAFGVVSYRIADDGKLEQAGMAPLPGGPTHLETDLQGRFLFAASYSGNCVSISPIGHDGVVQAASQTLENLQAPHSANISPDNQLLLIPCLKEDRIRLFDLAQDGTATPHQPEALSAAEGAGPRHMAFHPNHRVVYCVNELNSSVDVYQQDGQGGYRQVQSLNAMPDDFADTRWAADIHITPDGRFLYTTDRTASLLSVFQVSEDGSVLTLAGHHPTETQPRGFNIDHSGQYVITAGQKSAGIEVAKIDQATGALSTLARYDVGQGPMWVTILDLDKQYSSIE